MASIDMKHSTLGVRGRICCDHNNDCNDGSCTGNVMLENNDNNDDEDDDNEEEKVASPFFVFR
jgi:hypothetical protein